GLQREERLGKCLPEHGGGGGKTPEKIPRRSSAMISIARSHAGPMEPPAPLGGPYKLFVESLSARVSNRKVAPHLGHEGPGGIILLQIAKPSEKRRPNASQPAFLVRFTLHRRRLCPVRHSGRTSDIVPTSVSGWRSAKSAVGDKLYVR